jgi:hypothetical protein
MSEINTYMQLGWVDFSEEEKNNVATILDTLTEKKSVDEIGIGTIRDGFSEKLFPGFSSQQTRAKYLVLIPYLFLQAEKRKFSGGTGVEDWIHNQEDRLIGTLMNSSDKPEEERIIGSKKYKSHKPLVVKPSYIYWNALRAMSILRFPEYSFGKVCSEIYKRSDKHHTITLKTEDEETGSDDQDALFGDRAIFTTLLPDENYDVIKDAKIDLTIDERNYLRESILHGRRTKNSMSAYMLEHHEIIDNCAKFEDIKTEDMPDDLPNNLKETVFMAQEFLGFIYGAHLLYNIIFSNGTDAELIQRFTNWKKEDYHQIDLQKIINISQCHKDAALFICRFDKYIHDNDIEAAKILIRKREKSIKVGHSKLDKPDAYTGDLVHDYKLDYRYNTARSILKEILG